MLYNRAMKPKRIQRRRTKGWKLPPNTIYVGRPTKWVNPFFVGHHFPTPQEAVTAYRKWLKNSLPGQKLKYEDIAELRGRNLACWCALNKPCHADVLLEIVNCG
jgi:hypothetical protein